MSYIKCDKCDLCNDSRCVMGVGNIKNGIFIVGMNPDEDEERIGTPFVGKSGQLLNLIIQLSLFKREELYITNLVKANTPKNREPKLDEIMTCTDKYLEKELDFGKPSIVFSLGRVTTSYFTGIKTMEEAVQHKYIRVPERAFIIIPIYHPSARLRNGKKKEDILEDVARMKRAHEYLKVLCNK